MIVSASHRDLSAPDDVIDIWQRVNAVFGNRYVIGELLGQGSCGIVWSATCRHTRKKVAIKCTKKADVPYSHIIRDRLRGLVPQEVFVLARLQHRNIIRFVDFCYDEACFYLVTESCENCVDLYEFIERNRHLSEERVRKIAKQIFLAVAYVHEQGFVHRDIKDENVLIDDNDNVFLLDFGYSKHIPRCRSDYFTDMAGTAHCLSPELLRREPNCGIPQDVWALGVLLFTLAFGYQPFDEEALTRIACNNEVRLPIPNGLRSVLLIDLLGKMLRPRDADRISLENVLRHGWVTQSHPVRLAERCPEIIERPLRANSLHNVHNVQRLTFSSENEKWRDKARVHAIVDICL